jgi:hypothetical protein
MSRPFTPTPAAMTPDRDPAAKPLIGRSLALARAT